MDESMDMVITAALEPITSCDNLYLGDDGSWRLSVAADQDLDEIRAALPGWTIEWCGEGNTDAYGYSTEDISLRQP